MKQYDLTVVLHIGLRVWAEDEDDAKATALLSLDVPSMNDPYGATLSSWPYEFVDVREVEPTKGETT